MPETKPLRFSVVIPAYNEAQYIAKTLESLQRQDFLQQFEVIVVDNNSTDTTSEIAESLGARVVTEKESGVCYARQAGTEAARGEIVISTDADTAFNSDWLSRIDATFKRYPKAVAVTGPCHYTDGPIWGSIYPHLLFGLDSLFFKIFGRPFYVTATNIAFKKSAWSGYNTRLTQGGDELELLHDLRKRGKVVFNNRNPVHTSARRLARGLIYNFFVSFLFYYLIAYYLDRIFKRPVLGTAPKFRNEYSPKVLSVLNLAIISILVITVITQRSARHYVVHKSDQVIKHTTNFIDRDKK